MEQEKVKITEQYEELYGTVPVNKKNDIEWMKKKIEENWEVWPIKEQETNLKEIEVKKFKVYFVFYHDGYQWNCDSRFAGGETFYRYLEDAEKRVADYKERWYKTKVLSGEL